MDLEKFEPTGGRAGANQPLISIRKSAGIGINQPALEKYFNDAEAAEVYYDESENVIGLKPAEEKQQDNYTLTRTENGGSVTPKAFFNQYDLAPEVTKRYEPEWNGNNTIVLVHLDDPVGTYGSPADEEAEDQAEAETESDD